MGKRKMTMEERYASVEQAYMTSQVIQTVGPLIETGTIDDGTYELRGDRFKKETKHLILYVYRWNGVRYIGKHTQLGGSNVQSLARQLLAELAHPEPDPENLTEISIPNPESV